MSEPVGTENRGVVAALEAENARLKAKIREAYDIAHWHIGHAPQCEELKVFADDDPPPACNCQRGRLLAALWLNP